MKGRNPQAGLEVWSEKWRKKAAPGWKYPQSNFRETRTRMLSSDISSVWLLPFLLSLISCSKQKEFFPFFRQKL